MSGKSLSLRVEMLETNPGLTHGAHVNVSDATLKKLGMVRGDVIEIVGNRRTVASCHSPTFGHDPCEDNTIRMNAITRSNADVVVGDAVTIRKVSAQLAESVTLLPIYKHSGVVRHNMMGRDTIFSSSNRIPVVIGDNIVESGTNGVQILQVIEVKAAKGVTINNASVLPDDPRNSILTDATSDQNETTPVVIFPSKTDAILLDNEWNPAKLAGAIHPVSGFPAFWVTVGMGSRIDHSLEKYLSLTLIVSGYDGNAKSTFEVKMGKAEQDPMEMMRKMMGIPGGLSLDKAKAMSGPWNTMGEIFDIQSRTKPYVIEASRITEAANKEWKEKNGNLMPEDVKYRILKRWADLS